MLGSGFVIFALFGVGLACLPNLSNPCLTGVETTEYDNSGFSTTPLETTDPDLSCNFDSSCCWKMTNQGAATGKVITNPGGLIGCLPAGNQSPVGNFIAIYNPTLTAGGAKLESCPVQCTESATFKARFWKSAAAQIQVCQQTVGTTTLENCQTVSDGTGAVSTLTFNGKKENYQFVVVASGVSGVTAYAGVDDIQVTSTPCATTTTSTTTTTTTTTATTTTTTTPLGYGNVCQKLLCSFSGNTCGWSNTPGFSSQFYAFPARTIAGNMDTGVNAPGVMDGETTFNGVADVPFLASIDNPYNKAGISITGLSVPQDVTLKMKVYDACGNYQLSGCVDDVSHCVPLTNKGVTLADRQWQDQQLQIPAGSGAILLKSENFGNYYCAGGFAKFSLHDSATGQKIC